MTVALIFAGGTGQRMNTRSKPKQFLELHGKPVIIYTLEHFEFHEEIDSIVVVCLKEWTEELRKSLRRFNINKVTQIVPGGETGHDSICNGLEALWGVAEEDDIVLIHDGVRPLITRKLISDNIQTVRNHGTAITVEAARESVIQSKDGMNVDREPDRDEVYIAKAPQSFYYGMIRKVYERAKADGIKSIDSSHLLSIYGMPMHMVASTKNNIKITDPADYYMFRSLYEAMENQQIFGIWE